MREKRGREDNRKEEDRHVEGKGERQVIARWGGEGEAGETKNSERERDRLSKIEGVTD